MRLTYDRSTDTLHFCLRTESEVFTSDETCPGVILDYDEDGSLVGFELLDASQYVSDPEHLDFDVAM